MHTTSLGHGSGKSVRPVSASSVAQRRPGAAAEGTTLGITCTGCSLHLDVLLPGRTNLRSVPLRASLGMEALGRGGRREKGEEAEAKGLATQVGEGEDKRLSGYSGLWGLSQGTGASPVRVPQEFPREAAGPLGSYRPDARSSPLRPGEGVKLRSSQASCCALKQPSAPGDLGSQVNNLKP